MREKKLTFSSEEGEGEGFWTMIHQHRVKEKELWRLCASCDVAGGTFVVFFHSYQHRLCTAAEKSRLVTPTGVVG